MPGFALVHWLGSTLELTTTQTAVRDIPKTWHDTLEFVETNEWHGPHYFDERNFLEFEETPMVILPSSTFGSTIRLNFTEKRGRTIYVTMSDWLNLAAVGHQEG